MAKSDASAIAIAGSIARDMEKEIAERRSAIAVINRRLEKAGIPPLPPDEAAEVRASVMRQPAQSVPDLGAPEPTILPTRRRVQKGRM